jgi:hypothetical protein
LSLQNPDLRGLGLVSEPVGKAALFCVLVAFPFRLGFFLDRHLGSSLRSLRRFCHQYGRPELMTAPVKVPVLFPPSDFFANLWNKFLRLVFSRQTRI